MPGDVETYTDPKTTSTLTIKTATTDDAGDYKCTADFGGTTVESTVATVNVYGKMRYLTHPLIQSRNITL